MAFTNLRQLIFAFARTSFSIFALVSYPRLSLRLMSLRRAHRKILLFPRFIKFHSNAASLSAYKATRRALSSEYRRLALVCRFDTHVACAPHSKRMIRHHNLLTRSRVCNSPLQANLSRYICKIVDSIQT